MIFHVPGIPHTITSQEYISCAFTQKVLKLCHMLTNNGHTVYHYGVEGSNPACTENIDVVTREMHEETYKDNDWKSDQFKFDTNDLVYQTFHKNAIHEISKRLTPRDFLLCSWGWGHRPIAAALEDKIFTVEPGVGYESTFCRFRAFESYTWMAYIYGKQKEENGSNYDAVIPNYFNPNDFTFSAEKEDWFLYLGRVVQRKGVQIAAEVTQQIGAKLIIAGQGSPYNANEGIDLRQDHIKHVGFADLEKRRDLLSRAKAVFMPTMYIEPFGGVSIEAALSGTPVISSDWGVFAENILHGVTGYRCRTLEQYIWAARNCTYTITPQACRDWAEKNFSIDRISQMYEEYFHMLYGLWDKGWYTTNYARSNLDWLKKEYPQVNENNLKISFKMLEQEGRLQAKRIAEYMSMGLNPIRSAIDIGCGPGVYVQELRNVGIDACGIDIDDRLEETEYLKQADFLTYKSDRQYDLVICLEVAEHLKEENSETIVHNLTRLGDTILFSSAHPHQEGFGHVNCQSINFWIDLFHQHSFEVDVQVTESFLSFMRSGYHMGWLAANAMILRRREI